MLILAGEEVRVETADDHRQGISWYLEVYLRFIDKVKITISALRSITSAHYSAMRVDFFYERCLESASALRIREDTLGYTRGNVSIVNGTLLSPLGDVEVDQQRSSM
jgi:hypothetical protein